MHTAIQATTAAPPETQVTTDAPPNEKQLVETAAPEHNAVDRADTAVKAAYKSPVALALQARLEDIGALRQLCTYRYLLAFSHHEYISRK